MLVRADRLAAALPGFSKDTIDEVEIKSHVQLAEVYDYYGCFDEARIHSAGEEGLLGSLPQQNPGKEHHLRQAQVRLAVSYARSLYKIGESELARRLLIKCREYVATQRES